MKQWLNLECPVFSSYWTGTNICVIIHCIAKKCNEPVYFDEISWLCFKINVHPITPPTGLSLSILTYADVGAGVSKVVTTDDLLKSLPHLLAPEGIDQWVNHRVAHDEDEVHVEVGHEAHAVEVPRTGDHQDQVEEEGRPADDKYPQQDGQCDGPLHTGPLVDGVVAGQGSNALDVRARQHEHVAVEGGHDEQHGEEHRDEADDDRRGV